MDSWLENNGFFLKKNVFVLVFGPMVLLPFLPMASFFLSMIGLLLMSNYNNRILRIYFAVLAYTSLSIIYASRDYKEELAMDLSIYYDIFSLIYDGYFAEALLFFGKGVEVGIVVLYKIYIVFLGKITPYELAFLNMIICGYGCLFWIEKYGLKNIPYQYKGYCMFLFILFFSIQMTGFLQRQSIATVFLLFALSQSRTRYFYFLLTIGSLFHLTTFPLGILFRYLLRVNLTPKRIAKIIIIVLFFRIIFYTLVSELSTLSVIPGTEKLIHFVEAEFAIASGRFAILILLLLIFHLVYYKRILNPFRDFIIVCSIFYLIFLGIPLFSERVFFILLYLYGFYLFLGMYKIHFKILLFSGYMYFILFILEKTNLLRTLIDPFWQRYPIFDTTPFYYVM